jgi:polyhydroxyalkanoate synthesis regulator phasin
MAEMQSRDDRISLLEQQVAELQEEIKRLKLLIE